MKQEVNNRITDQRNGVDRATGKRCWNSEVCSACTSTTSVRFDTGDFTKTGTEILNYVKAGQQYQSLHMTNQLRLNCCQHYAGAATVKKETCRSFHSNTQHF